MVSPAGRGRGDDDEGDDYRTTAFDRGEAAEEDSPATARHVGYGGIQERQNPRRQAYSYPRDAAVQLDPARRPSLGFDGRVQCVGNVRWQETRQM